MSTRKRSQDDFQREIRAHIELEAHGLVGEGLTPEAAHAEAARRFGNVTIARERFYERRRRLWLDHIRHDLRCAIRNLRRNPVAAIVAIVSLAAGIGATTATLTVRNAVFYNMPPLYQNPSQLSRVYAGPLDRVLLPLDSPIPIGLYRLWRQTLGASVAAATVSHGVENVRVGDRTAPVTVRAAAPELFPLLGIRPTLGRLPTTASTNEVLLSHRAWTELFDARQDVMGRTIWIDGRPQSVVGVLPERFWFSDMNSPVWTVLDESREAADRSVDVVVRRRPGETPSMLQTRLAPGLAEYARTSGVGLRMHMTIGSVAGTPLAQQVSLVLPYVLGVSVLLTLLIACANVAILMIAQWTAREREIAVRASIGARRGRIIQMLLTESIVVAMWGGALGVLATFALRSWILHAVPATVQFFDLRVDAGVLAWTAALAFFSGAAAGLAPALYQTRRLQVNPLRAMNASEAVRQRWRHALVVLEIAVTVALLVETSALVSGYFRARGAELGYSPRPLLTASVERPGGVPVRDVLALVSQIPGVARAGVSTSIPFGARGIQQRVSAGASGSRIVIAEQGNITPDFFAALGVPLQTGRMFTDADSDSMSTAIVNVTLARTLYEGRSALGAHLWMDGRQYDVVGVVSDYASSSLRARIPEPRVFVPLNPATEVKRAQVLVRAQGDPAPLVSAIRTEFDRAHSGAQVTNAYTFDQIMTVSGQEVLVGTAPLFPLVAIGLFLTSTGIYGVLAFGIARRSRELAIRMAIGARSVDLVRLVCGQTLALIGLGSTGGIAVTFVLSRLLRAGGGAGSVFDPPAAAFMLPFGIVVVVSALAAYVPTRRAVKIDPSALLRLE